jgi:hypothetical protein
MPNPRIAVVAIHGVGDHQPAEMANSVANLLEDLKDAPWKPRYCTFAEKKIRINVTPVKVVGRAFPPATHVTVESQRHAVDEKETWGPMDALYKSKRAVPDPSSAQTNGLDHLFLEGQLAKYKGEGPEDTYEALRLEGKRYANAPIGSEESPAPRRDTPETEVHIYDMFWSDLSGVGTVGLRIFGELYQLLFHLGSIGLNNVKAAAIFFRGSPAEPAWQGFDCMQVWATAMLAWPIPLLNLIILGVALGLFADCALAKLSGVEEFNTVVVILFAGIAGALGYALWRKGRFNGASFRGPVAACLALASVSAIAAIRADVAWHSFDNRLVREIVESVATLLAWLIAAAGVWAVVCAYETRRPGTKRAFKWTLVPTLLFGVLVSWLGFPGKQTSFVAMTISLALIEAAFWVLLLSWLLFWAALVAAFVTGYLAVKATEAKELDRAKRTNWTARLTIALPAVLFLLLTVASWAGVIQVAGGLLPHDPSITMSNCPAWNIRDLGDKHISALCYRSISSALTFDNPRPAIEWANNALNTAGLGHFPLLLLLVCFSAAISIWAMLPSVLDEVSPPHGGGDNSAEKSATLGEWLDQGFRFMRWAGRLLYLGVVLFPSAILVALYSAFSPYNPVVEWMKAASTPFEKSLGGLVAGAAVGVLGFGGRLSQLALGFRPIVRVALDVDNWLQEHPRDSNPTARICGRYVSLLRYISQWQDTEDHRGYDALIVFAHSQGTVITADLLRFLKAEARAAGNYAAYDSTLARFDRMPVYLFTMGCPLRQLYGLRFPYLYGYAPTSLKNDHLPEPNDLGLTEWVNAYRTGDYVGRYLWRPHPWQPIGSISFNTWDPPGGLPKNVWANGNRVEFSIGPGAHTHYWDSTAEAIAETLDVLIAKAMPSSLQSADQAAAPVVSGH